MKKRIISLFTILAALCMMQMPVEAAEVDYNKIIDEILSEKEVPSIQMVMLDNEDGNEEQVKEIQTEKSMYTTSGLKLRENPGTYSDEYLTVDKDSEVNVVAVCDNGWAKVEYKDGEGTWAGYMNLEHLTEEVPMLPVAGDSLGEFRITYYCPCSICCGDWVGGYTASGTVPEEGRTIAADQSVLPMGTRVIISGQEYTVEDTGYGVGGNSIDMFLNSHYDCVQNGIGYAEVFLAE